VFFFLSLLTYLLDVEVINVQQGLDGVHYLLEVLENHLEHLLHDLHTSWSSMHMWFPRSKMQSKKSSIDSPLLEHDLAELL
jgi:hypothetical protein